ncbi:MAG: DUF1801 domain-containing protein [Alphaproteobacteria bacterium]|nr:DUF1801 domain-containing protein [Alphaproteobacteria bacterium]
MKRPDDDPQTYLDSIDDPGLRATIEAVRALVREVAPEVVEGIRYGMLDYPGLANLAAQKRYVALYVDPAIVAPRAHLLPGADLGKSCIRLTPGRPLPQDGIREVLRARWARDR